MASQISHIVYAKRYLDKCSSSKINEDEFILGTVFPDIRRVAENIKRSDTHSAFSPINLDSNGLTSFQSGWKFHLYCDIRRERILSKYSFYSIDGTIDFACSSSKLLEDRIIYDQYDDWKKLADIFKNPPKIDTGINIPRETFKLWYAILAEYISERPNRKTIKRLALKLPPLASMADEIAKSVDKLEKNEKAVNLLRRVVKEIV